MTLLQACLIETDQRPDSINVCLEISEITSKVLDWKTSKAISAKQHQTQLGLAEFVTCKYLQFIELIATNQISNVENIDDDDSNVIQSEELPIDRLQHLLFEIFKRILNYAKAQQA